MSTATTPGQGRSAASIARGLLPPLLLATVTVVGLWATWRVFVLWPTGQLVDDAAWQGSQYGRDRLDALVEPVVRVISEPFLVLAALVVFGVAAMQRRWSIAIAATVMLGGANVTTRLLKEYLLTRPDFGLTERPVNTLPSGHTTAAATVAATALLIAPARWRGPVALAGAAYAGATGVGTLVLGWHRPSDIVAAYAVAAVWYFLVEAARGLRLRPLPRGYGEAPAGNASAWLWFIAGAGVLVGITGGILTFTQVPGVDFSAQVLAYLTAGAGMMGVAALSMAAMLGMRPYHRLDSP
ncbi:phosphatase PAP2 family protein [Pseudactinotalea sp. Z1732]|uniref:phosphatase PAP2 family protein n=1 Tax=Pseudactinotalea sp. Z1732 TaxID=3413026 RepID=UPI003C7A5D26